MSDGGDCQCSARCEGDCVCGADWTPEEVCELQDEVARLKAMIPQWIPVSERLPNDPDVVIAYRPGFPGIWECHFEGGKWTNGMDVVYGDAVTPTHWMSLPSPQ
jgi:hypothetical protein